MLGKYVCELPQGCDRLDCLNSAVRRLKPYLDRASNFLNVNTGIRHIPQIMLLRLITLRLSGSWPLLYFGKIIHKRSKRVPVIFKTRCSIIYPTTLLEEEKCWEPIESITDFDDCVHIQCESVGVEDVKHGRKTKC